MAKKEETTIKKTVEELLKLLQVDATFSFSVSDETIDVILETKDTGLVIGYHGEILEALQLILSLCIAKKLGRFTRVSLEVGDYKKNRTDYLEDLAMQTKERVLLEKREVSLPSLRSWERRVVHMLLQDDEAVMSESVGTGKDRTLVVKPRE